MKKINGYCTVCFILYMALLLYLSLRNEVLYWFNLSHFDFVIQTTNLQPLKTILYIIQSTIEQTMNIDIAVRNLFLPIIAFIPIGAYIHHIIGIKKGIIFTLLIGTIFVLSIECLQIIFRRGTFDIDDIILGLIGIMLGICILKLATSKLTQSKHRNMNNGEF